MATESSRHVEICGKIMSKQVHIFYESHYLNMSSEWKWK